MKPIIKIENLSKLYRLGTIGTGTLSRDLNRWWARARGREDPYQKIGEVNDRATKSKSEFVWALKDINLEVMPGEVLGIIGKNGAGKSTLLKILSKVTGPTTGRIMYNGRIGSLLEVGTGFHSELTGRENIYLNGAILGMTRAEVRSKLDEIIDFSGCERYIDTPVKRYSSGMTVRLGFAVAAHLEPEILVVDEVLAVGDAEFQKKAVGKMQEVSRNDGRTVLFVSHNMQSIQNLCKRTIVLNNGIIDFDDETNLSIRHYNRSATKASYTGPPSSNKPKVIGINFRDDLNCEISKIETGKPFKLIIEVDNPTNKEVEVQLTFWDGYGILLWNLTHQYFDIDPLPPNKRTLVEFNFEPPRLNAEEIFLHVGLSYKGESFYSLVDHLINAASITIENTYDIGTRSQGIFRCPVTLKFYDQENN